MDYKEVSSFPKHIIAQKVIGDGVQSGLDRLEFIGLRCAILQPTQTISLPSSVTFFKMMMMVVVVVVVVLISLFYVHSYVCGTRHRAIPRRRRSSRSSGSIWWRVKEGPAAFY